MTCMELTDSRRTEPSAAANMVCRNGSCGACTEGMACAVTGKPCRVGTIVCTTGAPVCTETDNKPNGTALRHRDGLPGGHVRDLPGRRRLHADQPVSQRDAGLLGRGRRPAPTATPTSPRAPPAGRTWCAARPAAARRASPAMTCAVPGKPCRRGTIACNTGTPVCIESGNAPNGTLCGTNMVCSRRQLRRLHGGLGLPAGESVPRRHHRLLAVDRLRRHRPVARQRRHLRHRPGLQRRHVRHRAPRARAASRPTPARPARRRARPARRSARSRAIGPTAPMCGTNMVCTTGSCVTCTRRRRLHADANPATPGRSPARRARRSAPTAGQQSADGTACGTNLVCKSGQLRRRAPRVRPASRPTRARTARRRARPASSVCVETTQQGRRGRCAAPASRARAAC